MVSSRGEVRLSAPVPPARLNRESREREDWQRQRQLAAEQWESLRRLSPQELETLPIETLRSWSLCERLCQESALLATRLEGGLSVYTENRTIALADLAFRIACQLPPDREPWMEHPLLEFVWAHIGNARRVYADQLGAEEAFFYADEHYFRSLSTSPGPLDASRPFVLKAMLRRDQRLFDDALGLLRLAQPLAPPEDRSCQKLLEEVPLLAAKCLSREEAARLRKGLARAFKRAVAIVKKGQIVGEETLKRLRKLLAEYEEAEGTVGVGIAVEMFLEAIEQGRASRSSVEQDEQSFEALEIMTTPPYTPAGSA
jgi:hypothetical protein